MDILNNQSINASEDEILATSRVVGGVFPLLLYKEVYCIVTLGNPKQNCKYFGICRLESHKFSSQLPKLNTNKCLAKLISVDLNSRALKLLFLNDFLTSEIRKRHFDDSFLIETPYVFNDVTKAILGINNINHINPGVYPVIKQGDDLCVVFSFECATN
jgi:hypothetical protein